MTLNQKCRGQRQPLASLRLASSRAARRAGGRAVGRGCRGGRGAWSPGPTGFQPAIAVAVGASPVQKQSSGLQPSRLASAALPSTLPGRFPSERASTDIYRCIQPAGPLAGHGWPLVGAHLVVGTGVQSTHTHPSLLARYFLHAVFLFLNALFSLVFILYHSRRFDRTNLPTCRSAQRAAPCFRAFSYPYTTHTDSAFDPLHAFPAVKTKTGPTLLPDYSYRRLDLYSTPYNRQARQLSRPVRLSLSCHLSIPYSISSPVVKRSLDSHYTTRI